MSISVTVLDSDMLSELSRGNLRVQAQARAYLRAHGRLTFTAVTVFERLRGYHDAIRAGKPFERHLQQFEALVEASIVLPFDMQAAACAARLWAGLSARGRKSWGDLLIASIAASRRLPICTRNARDFRPMMEIMGADISLVDWSKQ